MQREAIGRPAVPLLMKGLGMVSGAVLARAGLAGTDFGSGFGGSRKARHRGRGLGGGGQERGRLAAERQARPCSPNSELPLHRQNSTLPHRKTPTPPQKES